MRIFGLFDSTTKVMGIFTKLLRRLENIEERETAKQLYLAKQLDDSIAELNAVYAFKSNLESLVNNSKDDAGE